MNEFNLNNGKFVIGKNEFTYQEALDSFDSSSFIGVITYNVESGQSVLLNKLREACENGSNVVLVTNIPKRYKTYFGNQPRSDAHKLIENYIDKLNPDRFGSNMITAFNFDNHAKIIVTDSVLYFGSENYSDASSKHIECGTITMDPSAIEYVKNIVFPTIVNESYSYFGKKNIIVVTDLMSAAKFCSEYRGKLFESCFYPYSDYETNFEEKWVFDLDHAGLTTSMLNELRNGFEEYEESLEMIKEIIDNYALIDNPSDAVTALMECSDNYTKTYDEAHEAIDHLLSDLSELTHYDCNYKANQILNNDYGMESFDENLEHYTQLAMDQAQEEYSQLKETAEPLIKELIDDLDKLEDYFTKMAIKLNNVLTIRDRVDNTGKGRWLN